MKLAQSDLDHKEFKGVDMGVDQKVLKLLAYLFE